MPHPASRPSAALLASALLSLSLLAPAGAQTPGAQPRGEIDRLLGRPPEPPVCPAPPARAGEEVVVFSAYTGSGVSTAALGAPDAGAGVVEVEVEPGARPLHLVLSSYGAVIWRFSGAVDRVARATLLSDNGAGAIGLPADRVQVLPRAGCTAPGAEPGDPEIARAQAALAAALGRAPDASGDAYDAASVSLPSGRVNSPRRVWDAPPAPEGFDPRLWTEAFRTAGPLHRIDPAQVVGAPAQPLAQLPGEYGLAQLVGSGALQRIGERDFRLVRPVARWPGGLNGAHAVRLLVGRGVPLPAGGAGHSCVVQEDDPEAARSSPLCLGS